jgi:hypothetical protein
MRVVETCSSILHKVMLPGRIHRAVPLQEMLQQSATKAWLHFERPGLLQQLAGFEQQLWAAGSQWT